MYAVEFDTEINNGLIKIPGKYKKLANIGHVRLVVLYQDNCETHKHKNDTSSTVSKVGSLREYAHPELIEKEKDIAWDKVAKEKAQNDLS